MRSVRVVNRRRGSVLVEHRLRWCAVLSTVPTTVRDARGRSRGSFSRNSRASSSKDMEGMGIRGMGRGIEATVYLLGVDKVLVVSRLDI